MGNNSQVSKGKASSEPLPKGVIRGFVDGRDYSLPGLRLIETPSVNLVFADLVGGHYKNKVAMTIKLESLGVELDIPNSAHFEIMVGGVLYLDVKGKVKVEKVPSVLTRFRGIADVEFDGGKQKFTGVVFDLSNE